MRQLPPRLAQGQAGVYAVAAQLLLRGINPSFPAVDRGSDIISDWGTRIQVKCSYRRNTMWGGSYKFSLDSGQTLYTGGNGYKKSKRSGKRMFSEECDFFVLWGIEDNRFWVLPSAMLDGKSGVVMVGLQTPWLRLDQAGILQDRKSGMSMRAIAEKRQVSLKTVLRVIHGRVIRTDKNTEFNKELLAHEDRWDLLLANERLISQGEFEPEGKPAAAEEATI